MESEGSVTILLQAAKQGLNDATAQKIFERYFRQLEWIARGKLQGRSNSASDGEDIAITVLSQFFLGVRRGQFPKLNDRHDLWQVLLMVLERRVIDELRRKRREVGESAMIPASSQDSQVRGAEQIPDIAPTSATLVELQEALQVRLSMLPSSVLRQVAQWKLEQRTNAEIAELLNCTVRTVERHVGRIRDAWSTAQG